jgi:sugar/nucleoside kinase (ribokinase family)
LEDYSVVDTTGAGDCFTSAFIVKYIELFNTPLKRKSKDLKHKLETCLLFANIAGFLQSTQVGPA